MIETIELMKTIAVTATSKNRVEALRLIHAFCMYHSNESEWCREQGARLEGIASYTELEQELKRKQFIESAYLYCAEIQRFKGFRESFV